MKHFSDSECRREGIFRQIDPSGFSEVDFEAEVVRALTCMLPEYFCGVFAGTFILDGERRSADLALIHKTFSHWFVVEVELISHSFSAHVLPQVRCFRFGDAENSCITSLCRGFPGLTSDRAESLLRYIPRFVAVAVNQGDPGWDAMLRALDVQLLVVSIFTDNQGRRAHELDGNLLVPRESIGFARYSAPDRSLLLPKSCGLTVGPIQIEDIYGIAGVWIAREDGNGLWITKETGVPDLSHDSYVQVIKTFDGRVSLRLSR
jgi:hypothetical protein